MEFAFDGIERFVSAKCEVDFDEFPYTFSVPSDLLLSNAFFSSFWIELDCCLGAMLLGSFCCCVDCLFKTSLDNDEVMDLSGIMIDEFNS